MGIEMIKALLVEDDDLTRNMLAMTLKGLGCAIDLAKDGLEGVGIFSRALQNGSPYDIVFCDIMMPRLDGYQTCSLIKHNKVYKSIPVIMLSSKDGLFDRARGRIVGSDQYLTKPFSKDELLGAIEQHVKK